MKIGIDIAGNIWYNVRVKLQLILRKFLKEIPKNHMELSHSNSTIKSPQILMAQGLESAGVAQSVVQLIRNHE